MMSFHWGDCKAKIEKLEFSIQELNYKLKLRANEIEQISLINDAFKLDHEKLRKQLCNLDLWARECERKALNIVECNEVEVSSIPEVTITELDIKESRQQPVRKKKKC